MKETNEGKTLNKKKIIKLIIIMVVIILAIVTIAIYQNNNTFRDFLDKYVFFKEKHENDLPKISIASSNEINTYAYKNSILVLENNSLTAYNSNGNKEYTLEIAISNPIFKSSGNYLGIAEKNGKKIYMISNKNIVWQKDLEENITDYTINSNGYVAVATTGSIYKTIIELFDEKGEGQFKRFLSSTYVIDMSISPDNKSLAMAEANFSGILVQSNIKIISIEKAKSGDKDAFTYKQTNNEGDLIFNIKYQTKDELICVYDNHIELVKDEACSNISDFTQEEVLFADLNNKIIKIIKKGSQTYLQVINSSQPENAKEYEIYEPKEIYIADDVIAINLGTEVLFYNNSGWLIKKYQATQEINKIVLSNNLAGIVYNDKIELVSL